MKTAFKLTAYTILLFFAVAMVASSCKKEDVSPTRIKTITLTDTQGNASYTETYNYDDQDRLSTVTNTDTVVRSYTYNDQTVVETVNGQNTVYAINSDGYTTSINYYYSVLATIHYGSIGYANYREQGPVRTDYTWNADNLVSTTFPGTSINYTYLSDKDNTIGNEYRGQSYLGKDSKNLVSAEEYTNPAATVNYTYEYDAQNRVTKRSNGTLVEIYTYY